MSRASLLPADFHLRYQMDLDNRELYKLLLDKGITHLNHANTVGTSITFIQQGGLLSREAVQKRLLYQTPQYSDNKDKVYNIWSDIFLDTLDLHQHFGRQNHYGPVLFRISADFLLTSKLKIWITKDNPVRWNRTMGNSEKYFRNVKEVAKTWEDYRPERRMITIRGISRPALFNYLSEIIIDDPNLLVDEVNLYNTAVRVIRKTVKEAGLNVKVKRRVCGTYCFCTDNYLSKDFSIGRLEKFFCPPKK